MRKFKISFYEDNYKNFFEDDKEAVKYLINKLYDDSSINFLWTLREGAAEAIKQQNREFRSKFPINRPKGHK